MEDINPLKFNSEKKANEFNAGVEKYGADYLIKLNEEVNNMYKQRGVKTADYKKVKEELENESDDDK